MLETKDILIVLAIKRGFNRSFGEGEFHIHAKNIPNMLKTYIPFEEERENITPHYAGKILRRLEKISFLELNSLRGRDRDYTLVKEEWSKKDEKKIIGEIRRKWKW